MNPKQNKQILLIVLTVVVLLPFAGSWLLHFLAYRMAHSQVPTCENNLRQMSLDSRGWAVDHYMILPSDFECFSNSFSAPRMFHCPEDHSRPDTTNWLHFSATNSSYVLTPGPISDGETNVYIRCKLHGHVCLANGEIQLAKERPK